MAEVGRTGTAARHLRKFLFTPLQPCHSYFRPSFGVKHSWTTDYNKQFFMAKTAVATPTASAATPTTTAAAATWTAATRTTKSRQEPQDNHRTAAEAEVETIT